MKTTTWTVRVLGAAVLATAMTGTVASAEEVVNNQAAETKATVENLDVKVPVQKAGEANVDEVITNKKLRAETGSKNLYSFSAALAYEGSTVKNPGSDTRPDIASQVFVPKTPNFGGTIGAKYKLSELQSLAADVGVKIRKPFHSDAKKNFRERSTISNPSLTYQTVYQAAGIQNVTAVSGTFTTDEAYREIGDWGTLSVSQTAIYDFGGSKFSVGLAGEVGYTRFDKASTDLIDDGDGNMIQLGTQQADYAFAFYPFAEYVLNDTFNLRTVFRPFNFQHVRTESFGNISRNVWTQSVGLGISITRDIFLYPNVQFVPLDIRAERTNVAISANINI